jgi:translation initiation factor IF-3
VRLIDVEGEQVGIVKTASALEQAEENGVDLVLIAPQAKPPVARLMNYGKFKYEQNKKEKDAKKVGKAKQQSLKEVKMTPRIEEHDYQFKMNHAKEFLQKGNKVKFSVQFKGRELHHPDIGHKLCDQIIDELQEIGKPDNQPKLVGRMMSLVISPQK